MITLPAPAKVNLYLRVTGRRADGYHLLDSAVVFADFGDVISVRPHHELILTVDGPFTAGSGDAAFVDGAADNLVMRAARALAAQCGVTAGAAITLTKNIPVAAGLGGGSADAAATLRALMALWDVRPRDLAGLLLSLGADVPVCYDGRAVCMRGIGEDITPVAAMPEFYAVLVNPLVPCATPAVFSALSPPYSAAPSWPDDHADYRDFIIAQGNDLTAPAQKIAPVIADVLAALSAQDGAYGARLCGSGASCFAFYADRDIARAAAQDLQTKHPAWWVRDVVLNGRD